MKPISLEKIAEIVNGKMIGCTPSESCSILVYGVESDSRKIKNGDLFVPILGERVDGHDFIEQCFKNGAVCSFTEKNLHPPKGKYLIYVDNAQKALLDLAEYYMTLFTLPVVAITGSVGKTTTKDIIASVLSQKYNVLKTEGNYNTNIGLPLTVFHISDEHEIAVLEMGMNSFGEIHNLSKVARPNVAVITNIGVSHIEMLGSRDGILQAKCEIFDYMTENGIAILNGDDDKLITLKDKLPQTTRWYCVDSKNGIYAENIHTVDLQATHCDICTPIGNFSVKIPVPGNHMVHNALAAAAVGLEYQLTLEQIKQGIESFVPTKMRMNLLKINDMTIINDVYNANPISMKAAIDVLAAAEGRKICIVGNMGELGTFAKQMHYDVGTYIANKKIDYIFSIGTLTKDLVQGAKDAGAVNIFYYETQEDFWKDGLNMLCPGDTILVKASRSMGLEKTVDKLQGVK